MSNNPFIRNQSNGQQQQTGASQPSNQTTSNQAPANLFANNQSSQSMGGQNNSSMQHNKADSILQQNSNAAGTQLFGNPNSSTNNLFGSSRPQSNQSGNGMTHSPANNVAGPNSLGIQNPQQQTQQQRLQLPSSNPFSTNHGTGSGPNLTNNAASNNPSANIGTTSNTGTTGNPFNSNPSANIGTTSNTGTTGNPFNSNPSANTGTTSNTGTTGNPFNSNPSANTGTTSNTGTTGNPFNNNPNANTVANRSTNTSASNPFGNNKNLNQNTNANSSANSLFNNNTTATNTNPKATGNTNANNATLFRNDASSTNQQVTSKKSPVDQAKQEYSTIPYTIEQYINKWAQQIQQTCRQMENEVTRVLSLNEFRVMYFEVDDKFQALKPLTRTENNCKIAVKKLRDLEKKQSEIRESLKYIERYLADEGESKTYASLKTGLNPSNVPERNTHVLSEALQNYRQLKKRCRNLAEGFDSHGDSEAWTSPGNKQLKLIYQNLRFVEIEIEKLERNLDRFFRK